MQFSGSYNLYVVIIIYFYLYQALESSSTWIFAFRDEEEKATWLKGLVLATYLASV